MHIPTGGRPGAQSCPRRLPTPFVFLAGLVGLGALALPGAGQAHPAGASTPSPADSLEALVTRALESHPEVEAARSAIEAAGARIPQAGALPDPMVGAALRNLPPGSMSLSQEGMTMVAFRLDQRLPAPGVRAAREAVARAELEVAEAELEVVRWDLATRLREAWFELLLVDQAEAVHHRTHAALEAFAEAAETAYAQGLAPQADILRAQTELSAIHEHLAELRQRRSAALAALNLLLDRPTREPMTASVPGRLEALLERDPDPGFLAFSLAAPELGPGLPTLRELEMRALERRPEVALAAARVRVAGQRTAVAVRERRPGIALSSEYAMRSGRSDFVSIGVSLDLPLFRERKQDQAVREAEASHRATLEGTEALHRRIRGEVAEAHAGLVRSRERLLLLDEGVIPQARAAVEGAAVSYRSGEGSFWSLLQSQTALFRYEIELAHLTAEVGVGLARLERAVGAELDGETLR